MVSSASLSYVDTWTLSVAGNLFDGLLDKVIEFSADVFRNIHTIIESEDLLDDLSDVPKERSFGEAIVSQQAYADITDSAIIMRPFTYGVSLSDKSYAKLPTRFSSGERYGVWYGSLDVLTTVYETVYHWKKRITDMKMEINQEIVTDRRIFKVSASGALIDLRGKHRQFPKLIHPNDYSFTQSLGTYLHDNNKTGLLVRSARHDEGTNIAAFNPDILRNPRHHSYLIYKWVPNTPDVRICRPNGKLWKRI